MKSSRPIRVKQTGSERFHHIRPRTRATTHRLQTRVTTFTTLVACGFFASHTGSAAGPGRVREKYSATSSTLPTPRAAKQYPGAQLRPLAGHVPFPVQVHAQRVHRLQHMIHRSSAADTRRSAPQPPQARPSRHRPGRRPVGRNGGWPGCSQWSCACPATSTLSMACATSNKRGDQFSWISVIWPHTMFLHHTLDCLGEMFAHPHWASQSHSLRPRLETLTVRHQAAVLIIADLPPSQSRGSS